MDGQTEGIHPESVSVRLGDANSLIRIGKMTVETAEFTIKGRHTLGIEHAE